MSPKCCHSEHQTAKLKRKLLVAKLGSNSLANSPVTKLQCRGTASRLLPLPTQRKKSQYVWACMESTSRQDVLTPAATHTRHVTLVVMLVVRYQETPVSTNVMKQLRCLVISTACARVGVSPLSERWDELPLIWIWIHWTNGKRHIIRQPVPPVKEGRDARNSA